MATEVSDGSPGYPGIGAEEPSEARRKMATSASSPTLRKQGINDLRAFSQRRRASGSPSESRRALWMTHTAASVRRRPSTFRRST
jgi:hypothetical protein